MLEEPDVIDIIYTNEGGTPVLVISDAGITPDLAERRQLLKAKLNTYVSAIMSGEIESISDPRQAAIEICCAEDPEIMYGEIESILVTPTDGKPFHIPVSVQHVRARF